MAYNKRRYRRVRTGVIDRANFSATKVTMHADGTWWLNLVSNYAENRPLIIALDGKRIDPFKNATEHQKRYGIVTVTTRDSLGPTHYGVKCGRPIERRAFEDRFKPVAGGLNVPV